MKTAEPQAIADELRSLLNRLEWNPEDVQYVFRAVSVHEEILEALRVLKAFVEVECASHNTPIYALHLADKSIANAEGR
jgi:hypothetical protein